MHAILLSVALMSPAQPPGGQPAAPPGGNQAMAATRLDGTWVVVEMEMFGRPVKAAADQTVTIRNNVLTLERPAAGREAGQEESERPGGGQPGGGAGARAAMPTSWRLQLGPGNSLRLMPMAAGRGPEGPGGPRPGAPGRPGDVNPGGGDTERPVGAGPRPGGPAGGGPVRPGMGDTRMGMAGGVYILTQDYLCLAAGTPGGGRRPGMPGPGGPGAGGGPGAPGGLGRPGTPAGMGGGAGMGPSQNAFVLILRRQSAGGGGDRDR
jgi:hypothetical protein